MKLLTADETLKYLIGILVETLRGISELESPHSEFGEGARSAFVECLEIIQEHWANARGNGLDFNVEEIFPIK